jgi:hypothetical protein
MIDRIGMPPFLSHSSLISIEINNGIFKKGTTIISTETKNIWILFTYQEIHEIPTMYNEDQTDGNHRWLLNIILLEKE